MTYSTCNLVQFLSCVPRYLRFGCRRVRSPGVTYTLLEQLVTSYLDGHTGLMETVRHLPA